MELTKDEIRYILRALEEYPWASDAINETELEHKLKKELGETDE